MPEHVQSLLDYLDASPTPFHAVAESARRLRAAGFSELREPDPWSLVPSGRHYLIRGGSSLVAFIAGRSAPERSGFLALGAHTDSPNLRIKPQPELRRYGYRQLGVEVYGSVLLSTWLDRDLSIAGRVSVERNGQVEGELIDFSRPLLRIPNLAIHLNRSVNTEGLLLNAQQHLAPILGLESRSQENLGHLLAQELARSGKAVEPRNILCWDLCLYDSQRATLSGLDSEFIQSGRLDNLAGCYGAITALETARSDHDATRVVVLYDHEEVGSRSAQGASSSLLRFALQRITEAYGGGPQHEAFARAMARSFLVSADMAHAIHPNYADRHESNHAPVLGRGPVLKMNVNQSYATDGMTAARLEQWCRRAEVKLQPYVVRSDLPCGSTIGPITAAELGLATVDLGNPLLSMHSVREMCACDDVDALARLLDTFFA
jgi:aspartyl aminopeptidase